MDSAQIDTFGLRVNRDIAFTTVDNKFHQRTMDRQLKILRDFAPTLKSLLQPDEEVLLAIKACSPMSWFEQLTLGWIIVYVKRCVLVVTNKRILHFPATMNYAPRNSVAEILYGDIAEIKLSGFLGRVLTLKYHSGKKENFNYIPSAEYKKLKTILPPLKQSGPVSAARERHHLCPRCLVTLEKGKFTCPNCHLKFKDGERARKLSIVYPGGGYFYTKHPILGIGDAITEAVLLFIVLGSLIAVLAGEAGAVVGVIIFGIALAIEKVETIYHTQHYVNEYIPLEESFISPPRN